MENGKFELQCRFVAENDDDDFVQIQTQGEVLEQQLNKSNEEKSLMEKEITLLKKNLDAISIQRADIFKKLRRSLVDQDALKNHYENELENLKLSSKATYEKLTELKDQEQAEKMEVERRNWAERIENLSRESERLGEIESNLTESNQRKEILEGERLELLKKIEALTGELENSTRENCTLKGKTGENKQEHDDLKNELQVLRAKSNAMEEKLVEVRLQITAQKMERSSLLEEKDTYSRNLQTMKQENCSLVEKLKEKEQECSNIQLELNAALNKISKENTALTELTQRRQMESEILEQENKSLLDKLKNAEAHRDSFEKKCINVSAEKDALLKRVQNWQKKMEDDEKMKYEKMLDKFKKEYEEEQKKTMKQENCSLVEKLKEKEQECSNIQLELNAALNKISKENTALTELTQRRQMESETLEQENKSLLDKLKNAEALRDSLEQKCTTVSAENGALLKRIQILMQENGRWKKKMEDDEKMKYEKMLDKFKKEYEEEQKKNNTREQTKTDQKGIACSDSNNDHATVHHVKTVEAMK